MQKGKQTPAPGHVSPAAQLSDVEQSSSAPFDPAVAHTVVSADETVV